MELEEDVVHLKRTSEEKLFKLHSSVQQLEEIVASKSKELEESKDS